MLVQIVLLVIVGSSQARGLSDIRSLQDEYKRGCGDTDASCPYWKELGFCDPKQGYEDLMQERCSVTCGYCTAKPTPPPKAEIVPVDARKCLEAHNRKRAKHGAPPLTWDPSLSRDAEVWALELANDNKFEHVPWNGQGENLYMLTQDEKLTCEMAVEAWYSEIKDYPFNSPPDNVYDVRDDKGNSKVIGHFTQLVWKSSVKLGAAISHIKRGFDNQWYIVARYTPSGNHGDQFGTEVGNPRRK